MLELVGSFCKRNLPGPYLRGQRELSDHDGGYRAHYEAESSLTCLKHTFMLYTCHFGCLSPSLLHRRLSGALSDLEFITGISDSRGARQPAVDTLEQSASHAAPPMPSTAST